MLSRKERCATGKLLFLSIELRFVVSTIDIYRTLDASSALLANGVERPHMAAILPQATCVVVVHVLLDNHNLLKFHPIFKRFALL